MNILIANDKKLMQNILEAANIKYGGEDIVPINKTNILLYINDDFYTLYLNGIGNRLFDIMVNRNKLIITAYIHDYTYVNNLNQAIRATGNLKTNIVNCCTPDEKGELTFRILQTTVNKKKIQYKRCWFKSQKVEDIVQALQNLDDTDKYISLGESYLAEKVIDLYIEEIEQKYLDLENTFNVKDFFILKVLHQREEKIKEYELNNYYKLQLFYEDIRGVWSDNAGQEKIQTIEELQRIIERLKNKSVFIVEATEKETKKEHPLLYNLADLLQEAENYRNFGAEECKTALESLYLKGHISNPNTNSRHLKESSVSTITDILSALNRSEEYKSYIQYIKECVRTKDLSNRIINDTYVDKDEGIIPTTKTPILSDLSKEEAITYDLIVKRFLGVFTDELVVRKRKIRGSLGEEGKVKTDEEIVISYGHTITQLDPQEVLEIINRYHVMKECKPLDIKTGELIQINDIRIKEGRTKKPSRYTMGRLLKVMENCGEGIVKEEEKVETRNIGIGYVGDRFSSINRAIEKEFIIENDGELFLTGQGKALLNAIPDTIFDIRMVIYINQQIAYIKEGKKKLGQALSQILGYINRAIENVPSEESSRIEIDYGEIVNRISCPICTSKMKDLGTYIGCTDFRVCKLKIAKVKKGYVLQKKDFIALYEEGKTGLIEGFRFKNTDKGKAYLRINREKRWVEFEFLR